MALPRHGPRRLQRPDDPAQDEEVARRLALSLAIAGDRRGSEAALLPQLRDAGLRGDVLFGSDFPNIPYPYGEAVDALQRLCLGDAWMRSVLYSNAAELFGLHTQHRPE